MKGILKSTNIYIQVLISNIYTGLWEWSENTADHIQNKHFTMWSKKTVSGSFVDLALQQQQQAVYIFLVKHSSNLSPLKFILI